MQNLVNAYLEKFQKERHIHRRLMLILLALALVVATCVYWQLRLTGAAATNETFCGMEEHTHTEECYETVLVCGLEECEATEGHTHTEDCYETQTVLVCGLEESEAHTHTEDCYTNTLTCGQEEFEGHTHTEDCYDEEGNLTCGLEESEGHTHGESCYTLELTCGLEESEGHTHTEECYEEQTVLVCELEECEATEGHTHTEECYETQLVCGLEEHTHTVACLIDETADVETASDWEATLPGMTGVLADDVVAVAKSQLGYTESTANFTLADDGETHKGYTRYGAWYADGFEYVDWDAMFASFCLYYGGVDISAFPLNSGAYAWAAELKGLSLYADAAEYTPVPGDLAFFDTDGDGKLDTVGVVSAVTETTISVIQGDYATADGDMVCESTYSLTAGAIAGYGVLPEEGASAGIATAAEEELEEEITVSAVTLGAAALSTDAQAVYDMFIALPDEDDFAAMTTAAELIDAYNQLKAAYDALNALSTSTERNAVSDALYDYTGKYTTYTYKNDTFTLFMNRWMDTQGSMDLYDYVDYANGVGFETGIEYSFETDDGTAVEPDSDGGYTLNVDEIYTVTVKVNFALIYDGSYTFTLPEGILMNTKTLTLPRNMGTVDFDGANYQLTFNITGDQYNGNVQAEVVFKFTEKGTYKFFDEDVEVTITADPLEETGVNKTGSYNSISDGKLYWEVELTGQKHSVLVGTPIVDEITTTDTHYYSAADIANGITITATYTGTGDTYTWTVYESDMDYWNTTGWSYTIPETVTLDNGSTLSLPTYGATGWVLVLEYTSTFSSSFDSEHSTIFGNTVTMEGSDEGSVIYTPDCGIDKTGVYYAGTNNLMSGGYVEWTITAYIPETPSGTSVYNVQVVDGPVTIYQDGSYYTSKDVSWGSRSITATIGDTTYEVPRINSSSFTPDPDKYPIAYSYTTGDTGTLTFYTYCDCTSSTCANWSGGECASTTKGYCTCWDIEEPVTITITFQTTGISYAQNNSALNLTGEVIYDVYNHVELTSGDYSTGDTGFSAEADAKVRVVTAISKALTNKNNNTVTYEINFNAHSVDKVTGVTWEDLNEIVITDTMSENLTINPDSIVITWSSEDGTDTGTLDTSQYTVTYDTSGYTYDEYGESKGTGSNIVNFTIQDVGQHYQYTIHYTAEMTRNSGDNATNSAQIYVDGKGYYYTQTLKTTVSVTAAAEQYSVTLIKVDEDDPTKTLEGADYELYEYVNGSWSLLATATTETDGTFVIKTDASKGVVLRSHRLYYLVEADAPDGYVLDTTKYYFSLCKNHGVVNHADCEECQKIVALLATLGIDEAEYTSPIDASTAQYTGTGNPVGICIDFTFTNLLKPYTLPEAGGSGVWPYVLPGLTLTLTSALALRHRWRRRRKA
ncbi:MAG: hypothetical protein LJU34_01305 [Oscillospiraceae bacterium]|nr:hypothetical protein [Oscillospiraceae bacterium]